MPPASDRTARSLHVWAARLARTARVVTRRQARGATERVCVRPRAGVRAWTLAGRLPFAAHRRADGHLLRVERGAAGGERLVFARADRVDREPAVVVGVDAPPVSLAEVAAAHARLTLRVELGPRLPAVGGGYVAPV